jgi:hypothetical protein
MATMKDRLEQGARTLDQLDGLRESTGNAQIARNVETQIVESELQEIEAEIYRNPGALFARLGTAFSD